MCDGGPLVLGAEMVEAGEAWWLYPLPLPDLHAHNAQGPSSML